LCLLSVAVGCAFSQAERPDVKGSQDHPQISRYPGSRIMEYRQVDFDQYSLPTAVENRRPSKAKTLEGKVTRIYYQNPQGRSTLEIYRNYEQALKANGFQEVFACQGPACGIGAVWNTFNGSRVSGTGDVIRYLAAQRGGESVSLMVSPNATSLHVIESKEMEAGLVTVSAEKMAEGIDREGHISLYAIYFDTGKSMLKPESEPALQQIAKLMASRPDLKLHVVGHTDTTGGLASNMKLSADRAAAVVTALTAKHGLQPTRLEAHGVGPLAPVATNATEEGKAKNRRVDLVAQ
jgi:outer membrane protein OmpA-like peptidoglycan-associated protein